MAAVLKVAVQGHLLPGIQRPPPGHGPLLVEVEQRRRIVDVDDERLLDEAPFVGDDGDAPLAADGPEDRLEEEEAVARDHHVGLHPVEE